MADERTDTPNRDTFMLDGKSLNEWSRREIEAHPDEARHWARCDTCGQEYDRRYLGDMFYHMTVEDHEPLKGEPDFRFVRVH